MIAYLTGQPLLLGNSLVILVQGVGYGVSVPAKVLATAHQQAELHLHIYTHVREESLDLYGFDTIQEKELFLLLLSVSGVGPKTALAIVDLQADKIIHAVQTADVHLFASVPRVGKKLAQKIIIELKSKLGSLQELNLGPKTTVQQDVADALVALGFADNEVDRVLTQLDTSVTEDTGVLIKQAIKMLSTGKAR